MTNSGAPPSAAGASKPAKTASKLASSDLLESLKYAGLKKEHLDELVKLVIGLDEVRIRPHKVFTKGIPVPDGLLVHTILTVNELDSLTALLRTNRRVDGLRIFPRGIPVPDIFLAEIGLT